MINIAIIEDEKDESDKLASYVRAFSEENDVDFNVKQYANPITFLTNYSGNFDIVFMDIELPDMDGMTAAHKLRAADSDVDIIFVTNMARYAVKGYEVEALDFIVKPVTYLGFGLKLKRALSRRCRRDGTKIVVKTTEGQECVSSSELMYVEILNHNLIYHTVRGNIRSYDQLKRIEDPLLLHGFIRISRCYLVNLRFVRSVRGCDVRVGDDTLQISRQRRSEFMRALADYLGGGAE